jgi:aspartyl-tRNA(Asn)/glutamyl-tRNA(Gln) amidotransferase subunit C
MKIDNSVIKHVASVSRLNLTEEEIKEFLPQLKEILDAFSEIQNIDTKNILPSYHAVELKNSLRDDVPGKCLDNKTALKNSSNTKDGYFKGPRVV